MSTPSDLDLDSLFLPAWAQQPANKNLYAKFEGREEREEPRRGDRGDRQRRPRQDRPRDQQGGPRSQQQDRRGGGGGTQRRDFPPRGERPQERPAPAPLPEVDVQFRPDEHGIDSLARQIKMTGRAYPLFGIAQIVLAKPERHNVVFSTKKKTGRRHRTTALCLRAR